LGEALACRWRRSLSANGVDDLHGTILEEKIFHMAGATTPQQQPWPRSSMPSVKPAANRIQRDSYYRRVVSSQNGSATGVRSADAELACGLIRAQSLSHATNAAHWLRLNILMLAR